MTLTRNGYLGTAAAITVISWMAQSSNDNLTFGGFIVAPFIGAIAALLVYPMFKWAIHVMTFGRK